MPEGDTIHRAATRLRTVLEGRELARLELRRGRHDGHLPAAGTRIDGVESRGKHLLVHFADGSTLHTHLGMHGSWHVHAPGARWRKPAHAAHAVLALADGTTAVCFSAPTVELRRGGRARAVPASRAARQLATLGPDLCDANADLDEVLRRLATLAPDTELGVALLDQRMAAGVGNVFKSEVCWACRIDPFTPLDALDLDTRRVLIATAHQQLRANLGSGPRTTYRGALAVYGKTNRACPRCGGRIRSRRQGEQARTTYWCARCQIAPPTAAASSPDG
ncbi:MAG TPA: DNA-formamidopyrimidine glycosylase family protein [Acidimicrobiia bacterium]|nr:DNA-formamidopyrimidine glycosylase family protein [Acidimicrobiia bacterium]